MADKKTKLMIVLNPITYVFKNAIQHTIITRIWNCILHINCVIDEPSRFANIDWYVFSWLLFAYIRMFQGLAGIAEGGEWWQFKASLFVLWLIDWFELIFERKKNWIRRKPITAPKTDQTFVDIILFYYKIME